MRLRDEGLTWQELDGELVVLDLEASTYLTTNGPGAFLMKELQQERTRDELVVALVEEYSIDTARAEADVDQFVGTLVDKHMLAS